MTLKTYLESEKMTVDKKLIWWMFGVTKGGIQRAHIVKALRDRPINANQLARKLELDYKTVRYHLDILYKNKLVTKKGEPIAMYFLSDGMEGSYEEFLKIYKQIEEEK